MSDEKNTSKALKVNDDRHLAQNANVGMKNVDPNDIRPPSVLLAQKLSDFDLLKDEAGKSPKIGQFFHTGELKIYDKIECYFLFAAKSKYLDKRKPEKGPQWQYRALAAMADDCSLFGMLFRVSSLYALSGLFGFARSHKRPMYSIKCVVETKELSGEKGNWFIPVVRILGPEKDEGKLAILEDLAQGFENQEVVPVEEESEGDPF